MFRALLIALRPAQWVKNAVILAPAVFALRATEAGSAIREGIVADRIAVAGLYQAEKIPEQDRLSVAKVVDAINRSAGEERARVIEKAPDIVDHIASNAAPGDIVLVMSNGGFDGVQEKILQALAR